MKKKYFILLIVFILSIINIAIIFSIFNRINLKRSLEDSILPFSTNNINTIFKIDKITLFSSCGAKNKDTISNSFTLEDLYQYTDIAIFIKSISETKDSENTLKKVWINNLNYTTKPEIGNVNLYYKNINNFAKNEINTSIPFDESIEYEITSDSEANLDNPILYNNLANPIVLSYINSGIKSDYTINDSSTPITYDGSLLKRCNVPLGDINCSLSFDIYITNSLDQEFKCTAFIDIPLENNESSIYDGSIIKKLDTNYIFYRYK